MRKINILLIAFIVTILIFIVTTMIQKQIINNTEKIEVYVAKDNYYQYEKLTQDMFYKKEINKIDENMPYMLSEEEFTDTYLNTRILQGEILSKNQVETSIKKEEGKERISVKLKSAENALSYVIKEDTNINLYVTIKYNLISNLNINKEKYIVSSDENPECIIKLLEDVCIIGVFDQYGKKIEQSENVPDTIMILVNEEEAKLINLIKNDGTFNITGI